MSKLHAVLCAFALGATALGAAAEPGHRGDRHDRHDRHPPAERQAKDWWTPRIDQMQNNQQLRIRAGITRGELTPQEAERLREQQREIQRAERDARADGHVSYQESRDLLAMLERAERAIQRQRVDGDRRHRRG